MRTFIAIPIDHEIRRAIVKASGPLREVGAQVKWVEPENIHVTLKFLGELDDAVVARLRADLRESAKRHKPFEMRIEGFGSFPRVVWVGCEGSLEPIASDLERVAEAHGVPREDRPFRSHATIGRIKGGKRLGELRKALEGMKPPRFGIQRVAGFTLFRSDLKPQGPVYTPVEAFPF